MNCRQFYTHAISNLKEQLPNENDLKFSYHIEQQKQPLLASIECFTWYLLMNWNEIYVENFEQFSQT